MIVIKRLLKNILSVILCLSFLLVFPVAASGAAAGDVDSDGKVTTDDARTVLKIAAGQIKPTASQNKLADMDGDGVITTGDARLVLMEASGIVPDDVYMAELEAKGFPKSYVEDLLALHKKYPQWEFEPFITTLDWATAVSGERDPHKKQLIENTVTASYQCSCSACKGVIQESGGWVSASQTAVEFYMDPRNFLTQTYIFQFEKNSYDSGQSITAVESILKNTWMYDSYITYYDGVGNEKAVTVNGEKIKYSQAIMNAAKDSNMSAYYIASKIVQEVGSLSSSDAAGASGKEAPYNGIYNYYNIAAYTGAGDGLKWAGGSMKAASSANIYKKADTASEKLVTVSTGTSLNYISKNGSFYRVSVTVSGKKYTGYIAASSVVLATSHGRPWTDPYKSIYYGAQYIHESFSDYQFTNYLQKFNVNPESDSLHGHEYMANVRAAAFESEHTYKAYVENDLLKTKKVFSIPVFRNMPYGDLYKSQRFYEDTPTVSCTQSTKNSLRLSWTKVFDATGYEVYRYNRTNKKYDLLGTTTARAFNDTGLKAETQYIYRVRAYKINGEGVKEYGKYSDKFYATTASATSTKTGVVKVSDYLNIREKASSDATIVTTANNGQVVNILGTSGEWYKVSFNINGTTYTGYAHSDYIVVSDDIEKCPYTEPSATLQQGDQGEGVKWLQWHLYKLGYLDEKDVDGIFGSGTYNAVVSFQKANSLDVDGLVGSGTRAALKKLYG